MPLDLKPLPTQVLTDLEFIFLGSTKLVQTLRESDTFEDRGDHFFLKWPDAGEAALIYKANLLQFGQRVRTVSPVEQTAVSKVVQEIKAKEAKAQGVVGGITQSADQAPASTPLPGVGTAVPADLWDRSPLTPSRHPSPALRAGIEYLPPQE